ncbi:ABC transporter substrate-binding protein [Acidisphaera sp. S103]|uniref:ABC transporter substrate-binding protein n=1 Tax=Acidisphaera sp. S103 TaxID=1747223 RepID=UPI00131CFBF9|nr:ABC transporter substrate-binding protein [Acidisphaera sp. S103]
MRVVRLFGIAATLGGLLATPAVAQIKIGAIISITGPTAALGVGYRNAFATFPTEIDGKSVTYIVRDDAADASQAVSIAQRMIEEDHVDAIIGPTLTSSDLAVQPIANAAKVPMIAIAPMDYDPVKDPYSFSAVQPVSLMVNAVIGDMKQRGVKTIAYIGYSDGFGDQVYDATKAGADKNGMKVVADERYARTDTSAESQVLKAMTKKPDAVMIGGSGTPGALPDIALHRRGYKGLIYGNHGMVSPAFLRVGGAAVDGTIAVTGPVVVYDQLPDSNLSRGPATTFMKALIAKFGPDSVSPFAGYSEDAFLLLQGAIPATLTTATPGTEAFRVALRANLEKTHDLVGTHGVYTMSPTDHNGMDDRARVLVQAVDGKWKLIP